MALAADASDQLLDMLQRAVGVIGTDAEQTSIDLRAAEDLSVIVTGTGPDLRPANVNATGRDFSPLHDKASRVGLTITIAPVPGGTRVAWNHPLKRPEPSAMDEGPDGERPTPLTGGQRDCQSGR